MQSVEITTCLKHGCQRKKQSGSMDTHHGKSNRAAHVEVPQDMKNDIGDGPQTARRTR
jgi:hypothetical protein